jgi:hypothetical protein
LSYGSIQYGFCETKLNFLSFPPTVYTQAITHPATHCVAAQLSGTKNGQRKKAGFGGALGLVREAYPGGTLPATTILKFLATFESLAKNGFSGEVCGSRKYTGCGKPIGPGQVIHRLSPSPTARPCSLISF